MALETKPTWARELKERLSRPYTDEELRRIRQSFAAIDRLNAGQSWPPGTYQRLLDLADAEDAADIEVTVDTQDAPAAADIERVR